MAKKLQKKTREKNAREKTREKNEGKTLKNQNCTGDTAAAHFTASRTFIQGSNGAMIMCVVGEKMACNSVK
jgi:hypothetical protein